MIYLHMNWKVISTILSKLVYFWRLQKVTYCKI